MDRNKIIFQKWVSLMTPQKAAVLFSRGQPTCCTSKPSFHWAQYAQGKNHAKKGRVSCPVNWDLVLELHCMAISGRTFLYNPGETLQTPLSPLAEPCSRCGARRSHFVFCRWAAGRVCQGVTSGACPCTPSWCACCLCSKAPPVCTPWAWAWN